MKRVNLFFPFILLGLGVSLSLYAKSQQPPGMVPDEYESDGGHMTGFSNGGVSAVTGIGSVKNNPAMLVFEKKYQIAGGYHWPSVGRDFYQVGVVDSQTSSVAAGFTFTSFREKYKSFAEAENYGEKTQVLYDSPVNSRLSVALAQAFSKMSAGIGIQFVNGFQTEGDEAKKQRGVTLGGGLAGLLTPSLRIGVSAENLANRQVRDLAPLVYRAGAAYTLFRGDVTLHLDYRQRERVSSEKLILDSTELISGPFDTFEKMAIFSFSTRIQDLVRLMGGYGREIVGNRSIVSGGIALINRSFSLSYLISKPYLKNTNLHQAVNLELQVSF